MSTPGCVAAKLVAHLAHAFGVNEDVLHSRAPGTDDNGTVVQASALYFGAATVYIVWMIVSMHRETVRTNRLIEVIQSQTEFSRTLFDFRSELSMELSEGRLDMASQARVWRHFDRLQKQMDAHFRDVRKLAGLQSARDRS